MRKIIPALALSAVTATGSLVAMPTADAAPAPAARSVVREALVPTTVSPNIPNPPPGGGQVPGCRTGKVFRYVWNPHKDTTYRGALDEVLLQREVGIYHGWYCRKPGRDKVKFKLVEACWTWIHGPEAGVFVKNRQHFRMYVAAAVGADINMANYDIKPSKHKDKQECRKRDIPTELEAWQYIHKQDGRQNLFVRFGGSIVRRFGYHDIPYTSGSHAITQKNGILIGRL